MRTVILTLEGKTWTSVTAFSVTDGSPLNASVVLSSQDQSIALRSNAGSQSSGGEHLSSGEVSSLPLNTRDFSKLLLLAAGTMTDTNGAANFTQQFAVNGQRGTASVFHVDGGDTSDPELGGATFSNFNVDAIQEVQSSSGVMPAEIGHGAAGFTNVVTKSGTNLIHGSAFEFLRNASLDARNFFDHPNALDLRRIPPFQRNEFGVTIGGPVVLPHVHDGRGKTFFFGEYQGFRQVLGTTQVIPVPTEAERQGIDVVTFIDSAGNKTTDTLTVPVNAAILPLLSRYPLPNLSSGPFGDRTFATSSKVVTNTDQFSIRVDHRISDKANLFGRFSLNQVRGPTTNPDQTAIDPTFGVNFFDHQRSAAIRYARTVTPNLSFSTSFGFVRSTPVFPAANHTDVALTFGDGLFQSFNSADGSIFGSYGDVYQKYNGIDLSVSARPRNGVTVHVATPIPVVVTADPDRLAQVVANLTENALKYASSTIGVAATALSSMVTALPRSTSTCCGVDAPWELRTRMSCAPGSTSPSHGVGPTSRPSITTRIDLPSFSFTTRCPLVVSRESVAATVTVAPSAAVTVCSKGAKPALTTRTLWDPAAT
jgi:hypothetical protein